MQLLTPKQVAERLSITPRQVTTLMRRGELPWIDLARTAGSRRPSKRISEADLFAFIERRRVAPPIPHTLGRRRRIA